MTMQEHPLWFEDIEHRRTWQSGSPVGGCLTVLLLCLGFWLAAARVVLWWLS